jgi:hypothetical protein
MFFNSLCDHHYCVNCTFDCNGHVCIIDIRDSAIVMIPTIGIEKGCDYPVMTAQEP